MTSSFTPLDRQHFIEFENINCSLCQGSQNQLVYLRKLEGFSQAFNFVKCSNCGIIYLNPRPTQKALDQLYSSSDYFRGGESSIGYFDYLGEENFRKKTAIIKLKQIEKMVGKKGKLLEIGCAAGFFSAAAKDLGWDVIALDISKPMTDYAKINFNLKTVTSKLEDIDISIHEKLKPEEFDIIFCWGTTGTFTDPVGNFKKIYSMLKPNGYFVFNATNYDSLIAKLLKNRWHILGPSSAHIYNKKTISFLIAQTGFTIKKIGLDWHHLSLYKIMTKLLMIVTGGFKLPLKKIGSLDFFHRPFPLPNFGLFEVYAQKKGSDSYASN